MNRQQKEQFIQGLEQKFAQSEAAFLVDYKGLAVSQMQNLRLTLAEKEGEVQVAKNRLVKIALKQLPECQDLDSMLQGQTALVFAKTNMADVAKILHDFSKEHEELSIIAGCCESKLYDSSAVKVLATLPSREVLLAQLCGVMNAPVTSFVMVLRQLLVKYLLVLKAIAGQKDKS